MTRWTPHRMPRMRRELADAYARAADDMAGMTRLASAAADARWTDEDSAAMRREAQQLRAADLYWVSRDMTRLALDASGGLPDWTPAEARPAAFGLLVWEDGLPELAWRGAPEQAWRTSAFGARTPPTVTVHGVQWAPDPAGIRINLLTRSLELMDGWLMDRWKAVELFAFGSVELPLTEPVPVASRDWSSGLVAALGATWLMMAQPTIADRRPLAEPGPRGTGTQTMTRPDREVILIELRRQRDPAPHVSGDEPPARKYHRRWVVQGHWRQQACGPGRAHRKPIFVPPHLKGPDGAPIIEGQHVHVWRR